MKPVCTTFFSQGVYNPLNVGRRFIRAVHVIWFTLLTIGVFNRARAGINIAKYFVGITVDNGISSVEGVKAAKDSGIKVLVTDHHLRGHELPEADANVNPNLVDDKFP